MWATFYRRTDRCTNGSARWAIPAALWLIAALVFAGCSRVEGNEPPHVATVVTDAPAPDAPEVQSLPTPDTGSDGSTEGVQPTGAEPTSGGSRNAPRFLIPEGRLQRQVPADAFIGLLADSSTGERTEAHDTAREFLASLDDPQFAIRLVLPEARDFLERIIVDDGPALPDAASIRIARARFLSSREAAVSVRLLVDGGSTVGSLVVENRDNSWYIADMLLDLRELSRSDGRMTVERLAPWTDRSPLVGP